MESRRLSDYSNVTKIIREAGDFYRRSHNLSPIKIIYYLIIVVFLSLFTIQLFSGIFHADLEKYTLDNLILCSIFVGGFFILLVSFASFLIYKMQRIILISEFQNLLFANAIKQQTFYFMILAKNKDDIIYMDSHARNIFDTPQGSTNISKILEKINLPEGERNFVHNKLSLEEEVIVNYRFQNNNIKLNMLPLDRPSGFFVIKAIKNT